MEIKIRPLTRKDTVTVAKMIKKMVELAGRTHLLDLISASSEKQTEKEEKNEGLLNAGIDIIMALFDFVLEDVSLWFADLVNLSLDDYNNNAPFDADLQIVGQLREAPDIKSFFTRALLEYKMIKGLTSQYSEKKEE
jgi:hypothetical protein